MGGSCAGGSLRSPDDFLSKSRQGPGTGAKVADATGCADSFPANDPVEQNRWGNAGHGLRHLRASSVQVIRM